MAGLGIVDTPLLRKGSVKAWLNLSGFRCSGTLLTRACRKLEPDDTMKRCEPIHKS